MILTIRTDSPQAELGIYQNDRQVDYLVWEAGRQLSADIHKKIEELLNKNNKTYNELKGVVVFKGPGSFTGLRIGISIGNSLAYCLNISIVARGGDDWISDAIKGIKHGQNDKISLPDYGSESYITKPRK